MEALLERHRLRAAQTNGAAIEMLQQQLVEMRAIRAQRKVSFQWKNPDLLLRNPDFLLKNVDFMIKQGARLASKVSLEEERGLVSPSRQAQRIATADGPSWMQDTSTHASRSLGIAAASKIFHAHSPTSRSWVTPVSAAHGPSLRAAAAPQGGYPQAPASPLDRSR